VPSGVGSDFKELVRSRTDLVQLIGERVALASRRGGREYVGLCPFHDDHTPSLRVDPERQSYKCWACGEGGDCFAFVQKVESVGFREALELLATRANLEIPRSSGEKPADGRPTRKELFDVLSWAEGEFHTLLRTSSEGAAAREYLNTRGFTRESIEKFRLGFAAADGQFLQKRARGRFTPAQLLAVRLVGERPEGNGYYDYFRGRVMFPIRDPSGRTVAFGGRVLPGEAAANTGKYINSPESPLFSKNRVVFALDIARDAIVERGAAVVMEGYADCIMAQQHGIANAVATLGTALTDNHVSALKRFTRKVVLVFDGDEAGRKAAEKSLPRFLSQDVDLRILTLTDDKDPADFLVSRGADPFRALCETAPEAWEYKLGLCLSSIGLDSVDARDQVVREMLELFRQAPRFGGSDRENIILNRLAFRVGLPEARVRKMFAEGRHSTAPHAAKGQQALSVGASVQHGGPKEGVRQPDANAKADAGAKLECELLEILLSEPGVVHALRQQVAAEDFRSEEYRRLLEFCYQLTDEGSLPTYDNLICAAEDADLKRLIVTLDSSAREKEIPQKLRIDSGRECPGPSPLLEHCIRLLKHRRRRESHEVSRSQSAGQASPPAGPGETLEPAHAEPLRLAMEITGERAKARTTT
jgi:DNA primase